MIPKVSEQALKEASKQTPISKLNMQPSELDAYSKNYGNELKNMQPEIMNLIFQNIAAAQQINKGYIRCEALFLMTALIVNAFYIQDEIDDVGNLFNDWDKS